MNLHTKFCLILSALELIQMQKLPLFQQPVRGKLTRFTFFAFFIIVLFSGCTNPLSDTINNVPVSTTLHSTPTPIPVPPKADINGIPTEALLRAQLAKVHKIMQGMSLDQKLGQLIEVEYLGKSYQGTGLKYMIAQQYVGGFMYQESNHNFDAPYDVAANVSAFSLQVNQDARVPLLIATDQEGGLVNRLYKFHGYLPSAQDMGATGDSKVALTQGTQSAKWMLELGINADLAPVVDVHTVDPAILASRMFGSDPKTVATFARAFLNGQHQNGVAGCLN